MFEHILYSLPLWCLCRLTILSVLLNPQIGCELVHSFLTQGMHFWQRLWLLHWKFQKNRQHRTCWSRMAVMYWITSKLESGLQVIHFSSHVWDNSFCSIWNVSSVRITHNGLRISKCECVSRLAACSMPRLWSQNMWWWVKQKASARRFLTGLFVPVTTLISAAYDPGWLRVTKKPCMHDL